MFISYILADFLYFPEDKSEYIPALISFGVFLIAAIFVFRFIINHSRREAKKAKELEEKIMNQTKQEEQ